MYMYVKYCVTRCASLLFECVVVSVVTRREAYKIILVVVVVVCMYHLCNNAKYRDLIGYPFSWP